MTHFLTQSHALLPIPTADTFGACSALFELGGMIVIHDPSGCNSTYTTHDEPRWYHTDSLLFISALTEYDAILGRDDKLIRDIEQTAREFHPGFICILPSQIATLIATDLPAISRIIEKDTRIPTFTLPTNSMHPYDKGIQYALEHLARHLAEISSRPNKGTTVPSQLQSSKNPRPTSDTPPAASGPSPLWEGGCKDCVASRQQPHHRKSEDYGAVSPASRSHALLREGGGFHKESFSCKETQPKPETTDVNPRTHSPSIPAGRVSVDSVGSPRPTATASPPFATTNAPSQPRIPRVNLLGLTPLDYHYQRALPSLKAFLHAHHLALASSLTLHATLTSIEQNAPSADVNLVLTQSALPAAKILETTLHIPYIAAVPYPPIADEIAAALHQAAKDKNSRTLYGSDETSIPSQPHSSEPSQPASATPPAAHAALPPLRGGLMIKDTQRTASKASVSAPPQATGHPSRNKAILREGGGFQKGSFSCKETELSKHNDVNQTPQNPSSPSGRVSVEPVGSPRPTATTNQSSRHLPQNLLLTEPLASSSLQTALAKSGHPFTILPPPASEPSFQAALSTAAILLSDPLYFPLAPAATKTIPLPRRAISGRTFEQKERNLLDQAEWAALLQELQP